MGPIWPMESHSGNKYLHWQSTSSNRTFNKSLYLWLQGHQPVQLLKMTQPAPRGTKRTCLNMLYSSEMAQVLIGGHGGIYYCPESPSEPTFDSFFYNSTSKCAMVFQMTVANRHDVKANPFCWLQAQGVERVQYIAVVPAGLPCDFTVLPNKYSDAHPTTMATHIDIEDMVESAWVLPIGLLS